MAARQGFAARAISPTEASTIKAKADAAVADAPRHLSPGMKAIVDAYAAKKTGEQVYAPGARGSGPVSTPGQTGPEFVDAPSSSQTEPQRAPGTSSGGPVRAPGASNSGPMEAASIPRHIREMMHSQNAADDLQTKGVHFNVGMFEFAVKPDHEGGVVLRPVFASQAKVAGYKAALKQAESALGVPAFVEWLKKHAQLCFDYTAPSGSAKAFECKMLLRALDRSQENTAQGRR